MDDSPAPRPVARAHRRGSEADATRGFRRRLLAVAALALAVRVLVIIFVDPQVPELGDAGAYHLLANHLADGRGYIRPFDLVRFGIVVPTAEYPPLHPFVLSLFARAGLRSVEAQRLGLAAIGTGTVALIGVLGRRIVGNAVGVTAAALAAISPMMFLPDATLMTETVFGFLVCVALLIALGVRARASTVRIIGLGVVLGLAVLARAEAGILAVFLVVPIVGWITGSWGRRIGVGAAILAVMLAVVAPWTVRNQVTFHTFVPVANTLDVFAGANCDLTYSGESLGSWRSTFGAGDTAKGQCFTGFNGSEKNFNEARAAAKARQKGLRYAADHVSSIPKVGAARVLRTFGLFRPSQQISLEALEGRPRPWEQAGTWMEWALYPFAIAGLVLLVLRRAPVWPLLAALATVVVSSLITYGNQRFRMGAEPTILIGAATGIVALAMRATGRAIPEPSTSTPRGAGPR